MPLLGQIWGLHFLTTAFVVAAVCIAVDHYGADYLMKIMKQYHFSPTPLHSMFTERLHTLARGAGFLGALAGAVLGFFITQGIVRPLQEIVTVAERVSAGERGVQVKGENHTEVGRLARAFNELVAKLDAREQMEKSLITNVAHELRTPLTNIRGYLEALRDEVLPPSKEIIRSLHEETLLLTNVVESLFALAEVNAATNSLQLKEVDLPSIVAVAISVCRPEIEARNLSVAARFEAGTEQVIGDPDRLVQVLRNLLQNSAEHTSHGGRVQVVTTRSTGAITVAVEDDGEGIDSKDLPFLFDRFFRGQRRGEPGAKRLGLGLAIVKELVEAHGGRVGADSCERGARVWFTLPQRES
jgi:signal transduction histidine kinase